MTLETPETIAERLYEGRYRRSTSSVIQHSRLLNLSLRFSHTLTSASLHPVSLSLNASLSFLVDSTLCFCFELGLSPPFLFDPDLFFFFLFMPWIAIHLVSPFMKGRTLNVFLGRLSMGKKDTSLRRAKRVENKEVFMT